MKIHWLFVSYLPLGVNMMLTDEESWRWAQPMYIAAAIGITLAVGCLFLMTLEPSNRKHAAHEGAKDQCQAPSTSDAKDLSVPLMQMQWQGSN